VTRILLLSVLLTSCTIGINKTIRQNYRYQLYIDYKHVSYQGRDSLRDIWFAIDSTNIGRYYGKLVIGKKDTFLLNGYEKGSLYPTQYKSMDGKTGGMLFFRGNGPDYTIQDTVIILSTGELIKDKTALARRPR
jgi:hypothetical protein